MFACFFFFFKIKSSRLIKEEIKPRTVKKLVPKRIWPLTAALQTLELDLVLLHRASPVGDVLPGRKSIRLEPLGQGFKRRLKGEMSGGFLCSESCFQARTPRR